jgi:adenosylcobyric acid synthase
MGSVLATTVHGLFEDPDVIAAVVGVRPDPLLETTYELLADAVDEHLDTAMLRRLAGMA